MTTDKLAAARITQRLTERLVPRRRNRPVVAAVLVCVAILAIAGAVTDWRERRAADPPAAPAGGYIIVTATVTQTQRPLPAATPAPTWTPQPEPTPIVIKQTVYVEVPAPAHEQPPEPETTHHEMPSDDPGPHTPPLMLYGERLDEYFKRTGATPVAVP